MALFVDCGCQKHHQRLLSSAALFYLYWTPVLNFIQQKENTLAGSPWNLCQHVFFQHTGEEKHDARFTAATQPVFTTVLSKKTSYLCSPSHKNRPPRHSPHDHCSNWGKAQKCKHHLNRKEAHSCGSCSPGSSGIESYCKGTIMTWYYYSQLSNLLHTFCALCLREKSAFS